MFYVGFMFLLVLQFLYELRAYKDSIFIVLRFIYACLWSLSSCVFMFYMFSTGGESRQDRGVHPNPFWWKITPVLHC